MSRGQPKTFRLDFENEQKMELRLIETEPVYGREVHFFRLEDELPTRQDILQMAWDATDDPSLVTEIKLGIILREALDKKWGPESDEDDNEPDTSTN